jgi:hypothetical protein
MSGPEPICVHYRPEAPRAIRNALSILLQALPEEIAKNGEPSDLRVFDAPLGYRAIEVSWK